MPRTLTENVAFLGSSVVTGYTMEFVGEGLEPTTRLIAGVGGAVAGIAGTMVIRNNPLMENVLDGLAAGSLAYAGSKIRAQRLLFGAGGAAGGATGGLNPNRPAVKINRNNRTSNRGSNPANSYGSGKKSVIAI